MLIRTAYVNVNGTPKVVAKGMGRQKTIPWDLSKSTDWNHGTAAGALILHVQAVSPELQYGDNIVTAAIRSLDAGYGKHDSNDSGTKHGFEV